MIVSNFQSDSTHINITLVNTHLINVCMFFSDFRFWSRWSHRGCIYSSCWNNQSNQTKCLWNGSFQGTWHQGVKNRDLWVMRSEKGEPYNWSSLLPWGNFQATKQERGTQTDSGRVSWVKNMELTVNKAQKARIPSTSLFSKKPCR